MYKNICNNQDDSSFHIIFIRFQKTISINASSNLGITREQMGWFIPRGYRPLGLVSFETPAAHIIVRGVSPFADSGDDTQPIVWLRNRSSSAYTNTYFAMTYAFIDSLMPWDTVTNNVYCNISKGGSPTAVKWGDMERDLPANAGTLLTMANAGPPT